VTGLAAGIIGGMLGVGGGIVMVPIFFEVLRYAGVDVDVAMHVAVGTSLATIVFNSLRSVSAHAKRGAVDWDLLKLGGPSVFLGAAAGSVLAAFISGHGLKAFFGIICVAFALYIALAPLKWVLASTIPRHPLTHAGGGLLGGVSALMGIGGGTFGVTAMTLCGVPIHRAVATGAGLGVLIGVPAAIGFLIFGLGKEGLPPLSLGYINWGALIILAPASIYSAPWGVKLAHGLPPRALRIAFGFFLAASGLRMLFS
jgi:uncharacterized membrane protein YfcA